MFGLSDYLYQRFGALSYSDFLVKADVRKFDRRLNTVALALLIAELERVNFHWLHTRLTSATTRVTKLYLKITMVHYVTAITDAALKPERE